MSVQQAPVSAPATGFGGGNTNGLPAITNFGGIKLNMKKSKQERYKEQEQQKLKLESELFEQKRSELYNYFRNLPQLQTSTHTSFKHQQREENNVTIGFEDLNFIIKDLTVKSNRLGRVIANERNNLSRTIEELDINNLEQYVDKLFKINRKLRRKFTEFASEVVKKIELLEEEVDFLEEKINELELDELKLDDFDNRNVTKINELRELRKKKLIS